MSTDTSTPGAAYAPPAAAPRATSVTPYLNFDGNTREAMTFYQTCLGGELRVMTMGEAPMGGPDAGDAAGAVPAELRDRVMHACLTTGAVTLMASDTMPGYGDAFRTGNNVWLNVACETAEAVDRFYALLGEGGHGAMPPHDAFWGARFAMLTDRYGVRWMFNHEHRRQG